MQNHRALSTRSSIIILTFNHLGESFIISERRAVCLNLLQSMV